MINCSKYYVPYKYVTARKAGNYLLARKVLDVVGTAGDPRILILEGLTPVGVSVVVCRLIPGNFGLLSSIRLSGVLYGG